MTASEAWPGPWLCNSGWSPRLTLKPAPDRRCQLFPSDEQPNGRHWNELPIAVERDGVVIEGIIDLLYREDDGSLVIVDFKTDVQISEATQSAYWHQLSLYAELLAETTGERISELVLVLCRPNFADVRRQKLQHSSAPLTDAAGSETR